MLFPLLLAGASACAAYPEKPVRIIVPSPTGGGTDTSTRIIAPKIGELLGQQIVIDNRGGASGNIGAEIAARSVPDGYTLLAVIASHTSNPAMMRKVPYDMARDFAPISLTVTLPNVLVSHPSLPVKNIRELIAFAKARPGQLQFASGGLGANQHLAMELFLNMAGLKMIHVPYKGVGPALVDVVAGHVPLMVGNILVAMPHVRSGRIRAYGVTSARRASGVPEIPTIAESGLPGYEAVQWYGLVAPAKTPSDIVTKLHGAVVKVLQDPEMRKRFQNDGAEATPSTTPDEFATLIRNDLAKWAKVVKDANLQPE
ncbi:MAG: tripartite tricarboxylate transporter substrate binding protein [Burkholderiales bacterium]